MNEPEETPGGETPPDLLHVLDIRPADIPVAVPPNPNRIWRRSGAPVAIYWYPDGTVRMAHVCDRRASGRSIIVQAPALQTDQDNGHQVQSLNPLTISPSLRCPDCGLHGHIRADEWVPA